VHRDIKPENVMLRPDGLVKVLDFGLAKLTGPADTVGSDAAPTMLKTDAGLVLGTTSYMSPEQARGQEVDSRTDVWSLGVMLYELVAGRTPFAGPTGSDVLAAILQNEPAPLGRFQPDAPPELQRILSKALQKDRGRRYQVVQDMLLDLQTLRDESHSHERGESGRAAEAATHSPPTGANERAASAWPPRRVVFVAAVILIVVAGAATWWQSRAARQRPVRQSTALVQRNLTRLTFGPGLQTDGTLSPDGRFVAYVADRSGSFDIWVQPVAGGEPVQATRSRAHEMQPDWSPDGSVLAFRSEANGGGIHVVPALGGPERRLTDGGYRPRFSPDGRQILYLSSLEHETTSVTVPDLHVVPVDGGASRRLFGRFWDQVAAFSCADWHPDGKRVSFTGTYMKPGINFFTVELPDGLPVASHMRPAVAARARLEGPTAAPGATSLREFRWDASGRRLFFSGVASGLQNLWAIDVDPTTLEWQSGPDRLTWGAGSAAGVARSGDGRRLVFTVRKEVTRV
jgi:hypothetical protein